MVIPDIVNPSVPVIVPLNVEVAAFMLRLPPPGLSMVGVPVPVILNSFYTKTFICHRYFLVIYIILRNCNCAR